MISRKDGHTVRDLRFKRHGKATNAALAPSCKGAKLVDGMRFPANVSGKELAGWAESIDV